MKVVELSENRKIEWECVESDAEWKGTGVSFTLSEKNGVTTILLSHFNWKEATDYYRWCNYNWAMFLYSLKMYCEDGKGLPFQERKF